MTTTETEKLLAKLKQYLPPHLAKTLSHNSDRDTLLTVLIHITSLRYTLSTYLPKYLVELITNDPTPGQVGGGFRHGSVMFADVSGFTAMSEKLAVLGKEGAEEITSIVNDYFDTMLGVSADFGGDLLKFGGDALLIFFEGSDGPHRALATAQAMQGAMSRFAQVQTSQGIFPLKMSIGIGSGPVFLANLGSIEQMEYAVMGRTLANMARAETVANAGQVMVDEQTRQATVHQATFDPVEAEAGLWLLGNLAEAEQYRTPPPQTGELPLLNFLENSDEMLSRCAEHVTILDALHPFVPDELLNQLIVDPQRSALPGSHRPVTVMFANFYGIDEIIETLGPTYQEAITAILNTHFETMSEILARYAGIVNKVDSYAIGHRIMALFGALRAREDDPELAVRAALEMNHALETVNRRTLEILTAIPGLTVDFGQAPLKQRIGLNSGFVFAGNVGSSIRREYSVMGDQVNLTARLMGVAEEGEVLISQTTARHVADDFTMQEQEPVRVKGKSAPVRNFVVTGERERPLRWAKIAAGPIVGRAQELAAGLAALEQTLAGEGQILVISGSSGIGKTRLAEEVVLQGQAQGMSLMAGTCLSYGRAMTYHPWADILRAYFGIQQNDPPPKRIGTVRRRLEELGEGIWAPIIGEVLHLEIADNDLTRTLDAQLRRQRLLDLTLKLLQIEARRAPLMVIIEDTHWADPASLDLISYLGRNIGQDPILLILPHRPEEDLPNWEAYDHAVSIVLNDLLGDASLEIVQGMLGPVDLPDALRNLVLAKGAGNPFFIEEVVRGLIDSGVFEQKADGSWQVAHTTETVELPDTIHGIIISRIDRLLETDRRILQVASVVGPIFGCPVIDGVYNYGDLEGTVERRLDHLGKLGLTEAESPSQALYRFKHLTTREVVYESQAFEQRRSLHRRIANFVERHAANMSEEVDNLAYHYFEGHSWAKAMAYNLRAAQHAQREFANDAAVTAYRRTLEAATRLEQADGPEALTAHEALGEILTLLGQYDEALQHLATAREMLENRRADAATACHLAELCRKTADVYEKRSEFDTAFEWLEQGLQTLTDDAPTIEAAQIYLLGAGVFHRQGKNDEAIAWCEKSLETASQIQSEAGLQAVGQAYYLMGGIIRLRGDLDRAVNYCRQSISVYEALDDLVGLSKAYINLANAYNDQGDWQRAEAAFRESLQMKQTIGDVLYQGVVLNNLAQIPMNRGQWKEAANLFQQGLSIWRQLGVAWPEGVTLSNLAQVYIYQQRWAEAKAALQRSETIFANLGSEDFLPELERRWGELYLQTGEPAQALRHVQRSLALAAQQEARLEEGMTYRVLGQVYLHQQNWAEASVALIKSLEILQVLNSEYETARTQLFLAQTWFEQGQPEKAALYLGRAVRAFEKLGAQADLRTATTLQHRLS